MAKHRFCRLRPDLEPKGLKTCWKALKLKHLSVKTANNEKFKYFLLKGWLLLYRLAEKNQIERMQFCLLFFDNNQSKNKSEKIF